MSFREKMKVPSNVATGNMELTHECFPKHLRMGTVRTKYDKETDEGGKTRGVNMERRKVDTKERSSDCQIIPNQNTMIINIICQNFIRYGKSTMKFNSNSIDKKQNGLKYSKNDIIHPPPLKIWRVRTKYEI